MTAKTMQKNKREQRATRRDKHESLISSGTHRRRRSSGVDRAINRMLKLRDFRAAQRAAAEKLFGSSDAPDRVGSDTTFEQRTFGEPTTTDDVALAAQHLSSSVVSLALFDGDKMLFACSGIALPRGTAKLHQTRFVTSARLVEEFKDKRNRDDKLRIEVRLPNSRTIDGFLGLYDRRIAIVTSFCFPDVCPVDLDTYPQPYRGARVAAAGRAVNSCSLMVTVGAIADGPSGDDPELTLSTCDITEAGLGGPLIDLAGGCFVGVNIRYDTGGAWFLPRTLLRKSLEHFQILSPKTIHFRGYSLPSGVSSVEPSGFMRRIKWLKFMGYPMPPPLVLELNGKLLNKFEEDFGELLAWKGYPLNVTVRGSGEHVWARLPKDVVTNISRNVVSLASFNGDVRFFACTGLLIKWHGSRGTRTVILTSASLVRTRDDEDKIDENLRIEVFLPPKQRVEGALELYHKNYNIAIVSVKKHFNAIRPEDIFNTVQKSSKKVVAIGRSPKQGLLMASIGEVKPRNNCCKLDCEYLKLSTCKIKKAGIGGPLINFCNGSFVGMNFYDESGKTPFLPRSEIVEVLRGFDLPSESGRIIPVHIDVVETMNIRWPVPEPYWYHGLLDVDRLDLHRHVGRVLQ